MFSLLLEGVDLYASLGRDWDLLEIMRQFAHDAEGMVHNSPTAGELPRLYEADDRGASPTL